MVNQASKTQNILNSYKTQGAINHIEGPNLPSKNAVADILINLKNILFPGYFENLPLDKNNLDSTITSAITELETQLQTEIEKSLSCKKDQDCKEKALSATNALIEAIPSLRETLKKDLSAIYNGDPAASCEDEIILAYPGFLAITIHRIAHFLYTHKIPLIPRIMAELAHSETGIDIHPGARVGENFCIDHGTGIVIGETAIIGNHVKLYQGVTIGAMSITERGKTGKRHPTIQDGVTIYARTTILGGDTTIGKNAIIGGNVWLTHSVPENAKIYISENREQIQK